MHEAIIENNKCPNPDLCGSCGWAHIPYENQLKQKLSDINGSFKIKNLTLECTEILPAPVTSHYRNRMDFVINFKGEMGLREKGKWWRVIDNHPCFISDVKIEDLFFKIRDWTKTAGLTFFDRKAYTGLLRYAVIRATLIGESLVTIVTSAPLPEEEEAVKTQLENLAKHLNCTSLIWAINHTNTDVSSGDELRTISGPGFIKEKIRGNTYKITPNSFFQTNSSAAGLLMDTVTSFAMTANPELLLDLYCGSGFFSIPLAKKINKVIGIEIVPEAIQDAIENAKNNNVSVDFRVAKTESADWKSIEADTIILDPPRAGLHDKVIADIMIALPKNIVYVSCNFKSFAREMVSLGPKYEVSQMVAIDMFPHTPHVELVSHLVRR